MHATIKLFDAGKIVKEISTSDWYYRHAGVICSKTPTDVEVFGPFLLEQKEPRSPYPYLVEKPKLCSISLFQNGELVLTVQATKHYYYFGCLHFVSDEKEYITNMTALVEKVG